MSSRYIILDANILVRAVLGKRVPALLDQYGGEITFLAPSLAFSEAARHIPTIALKRGNDPSDLLESLDRVRLTVGIVSENVTSPLKSSALARVGSRDPYDWPIVAAALALGCPIWTEDRDFFGAGVATWTTLTVEIYLRGD